MEVQTPCPAAAGRAAAASASAAASAKRQSSAPRPARRGGTGTRSKRLEGRNMRLLLATTVEQRCGRSSLQYVLIQAGKVLHFESRRHHPRPVTVRADWHLN